VRHSGLNAAHLQKHEKPAPFDAGFKIETQRATALISRQIEICEPSKTGGQLRIAV
jgi:hypothetical protein